MTYDAIIAQLPHWHSMVGVAAGVVALLALVMLHHRIAALAGASLWNVSDLFADPATGHLDPRRSCYTFGGSALTFGFLKVLWSATITDGVVSLFLAYGALMMFPQVVERVLLARFGASTASENNKSKGGSS